MPELPEVQTIVNDLQIIAGDSFIGFSTNFNKAIKSDNFEKEIVGQKIKNIKRNGKNIVLELDNRIFLLIHLKMTGKLILSHLSSVIGHQEIEATNKHIHHVFYLKKNGSIEFHDIRKFATLEIVDAKKLFEISKIKGIDPLSENFTLKKFIEILENRKNRNIKSILMDQSIISGIGNIYASEIPFDAKISPLRKIGSLNKNEISALHKSIIKILKKAIRLRGTSFSDYRDAKGLKGSFQDHLKVYKKAGKKCLKCDTIIQKVVIEQRSTFFCPTCQK